MAGPDETPDADRGRAFADLALAQLQAVRLERLAGPELEQVLADIRPKNRQRDTEVWLAALVAGAVVVGFVVGLL